MSFNFTQYYPASREPVEEILFSRSSNGTLRGKTRVTNSLFRFEFHLHLTNTELVTFEAFYALHRTTAFNFTWQEDASEHSVMFIEKPRYVSSEGDTTDVSIILETA